MFNTARRKLLYHNAKRVIFLDHSNLQGDAYLRVIQESIVVAKDSGIDNRLVLVDATNSIVNKDVLQALKQLTKEASSKLSKTAVVGVGGMQTFFLKTVAAFSNTNIKPFRTREEALEWLTS